MENDWHEISSPAGISSRRCTAPTPAFTDAWWGTGSALSCRGALKCRSPVSTNKSGGCEIRGDVFIKGAAFRRLCRTILVLRTMPDQWRGALYAVATPKGWFIRPPQGRRSISLTRASSYRVIVLDFSWSIEPRMLLNVGSETKHNKHSCTIIRRERLL